MKIDIPCDEEGFVILQCRLCGEYFKLLATDINDESHINIWCPYCGLNGESFVSEEVANIALKMAMNEMNNIIFDSFKDLEKSTRNNKCLKFKAGKKPNLENISPIKVGIDNLEKKHYKCCGAIAKIKLLSIECGSYCPICGGIDYE